MDNKEKCRSCGNTIARNTPASGKGEHTSCYLAPLRMAGTMAGLKARVRGAGWNMAPTQSLTPMRDLYMHEVDAYAKRGYT